ncbi:MAG TPA: hypothetical protein VFA78_00210, partial [Chloroflexota bacterium]|nr:hypothetical protein [Chloroflexota bacterium]
PLILILDDFHHADAASVHLLYELAKSAPARPWLICLTVRTEGVRTGSPVGGLLPVLRQESLARYIALNRLSPDDTAAVIKALLGSPAGEQARQRIYDLSLGNPLMTREVTLDMRESGRIRRAGEEWEISGEEEDRAPAPLGQILLGRLNRLGPEARNVMDVAAILGFEFSLAELRTAVQRAFPSQSAEDLLLALDTALEHRFLFSQGGTYAFTHPMVRLALIDDMPEHRRSHTHGAVARALETINPTDVDRLAFHFSRSYERDKAIEYLDQAATRAAGLFANVEAAAYYTELLRFVDEPAQRVEAARARLRLGRVLVRLGRYDDAVRELRHARDSFATAGSCDDMAYVTSLIGDAYLHKGAPGEGEAAVTAFLHEYDGRISPVARATLYTMLSQLYFPLGRPHDQLAAAEEAERLTVSRVDEPHAHRLLGIAVAEHGAALMALGRTDEAASYLMQGLQINERSGTLLAVSRAATALARLAGIAGDFDQEGKYLQMALKAAETLGSPSRMVFVLARLSRRATLIGNFAEGREYAERARVLDAEHPSSSRTIVYLALAELAAAVGDAKAVRAFVDEGRSQADALQDIWFGAELEALDIEFQILQRNPQGVTERLEALLAQPHLRPAHFRRLLAQAYVQLGRIDEADAEVTAAEEYARRVNDRLALPMILGVRAGIRAARGKFGEAQQLFDEALEQARQMGLPRLEAMLLRARGTTARRNGHTALARGSLEAAQELFDRLGADGIARLIHDELTTISDEE